MLTQSNAGLAAGPSDSLELVDYGAGYAWLKPELAELDVAIADADRLGHDADRLLGHRGEGQPQPAAANVRYGLTQRGRDYLAHQRALANMVGPWPTLAEVDRIGVCRACHQLQTAPSCATRDHWAA